MRDAQSHKRLAIQLAAQMPEDLSDALVTIDYLRKLMLEFYAEGVDRPATRVVELKPVS